MLNYNVLASDLKAQQIDCCEYINTVAKFVDIGSVNAMKAKNLNNSSRKTRAAIKRVFAELLCEKQELGKITVSELVRRADINRGTFYLHYDDIYGVAEDYENELMSKFFNDVTLLQMTDLDRFIDFFFEYIRENDENYKMLCRSNDMLFIVKKLSSVAVKKLTEICVADPRIINKQYIEVEIAIFVDGLILEYIKYCRSSSLYGIDELYNYTKHWGREFVSKRKSAPLVLV